MSFGLKNSHDAGFTNNNNVFKTIDGCGAGSLKLKMIEVKLDTLKEGMLSPKYSLNLNTNSNQNGYAVHFHGT